MKNIDHYGAVARCWLGVGLLMCFLNACGGPVATPSSTPQPSTEPSVAEPSVATTAPPNAPSATGPVPARTATAIARYDLAASQQIAASSYRFVDVEVRRDPTTQRTTTRTSTGHTVWVQGLASFQHTTIITSTEADGSAGPAIHPLELLIVRETPSDVQRYANDGSGWRTTDAIDPVEQLLTDRERLDPRSKDGVPTLVNTTTIGGRIVAQYRYSAQGISYETWIDERSGHFTRIVITAPESTRTISFSDFDAGLPPIAAPL